LGAAGCITLPIIVGSVMLLLLLFVVVAVPESMTVEDDMEAVSGWEETKSFRHSLLLLTVVEMMAVVVFVSICLGIGFIAILTGCIALLAGSLMESSFVLPHGNSSHRLHHQ